MFSPKTKLMSFVLLVVLVLWAGCGEKPKTEAPPGGTPAGQGVTEKSKAGTQQAEGDTQTSEKLLTAKEAVALVEAKAKQELGTGAGVVSVHGRRKGTTVDGKAAEWDIIFANPARESLRFEITDGRIAAEMKSGPYLPMEGSAGGKWIDSAEAAETARAGGGDSFKHTVVNPSINYTLGRLDEIAWYGDKKAGVINAQDQRPAWRVTYDNQEHYYVDAISGALIAKGSYQNRP